MTIQYQLDGRTAASLAQSIEAGVVSGALAPSELLPPIRDLAGRLGVSPGTVAAGYRLARQRGLTVSDGRRGTRVRPWRHEVVSAPDHEQQDPPGPPGAVDVGSGRPDPALLPDLGQVLTRLDYAPGTYGSPVLEHRLEAVARSKLLSEGIAVASLTCTFGALDAIGRVLSSSLRPGDRVAIEDPGWPGLIDGSSRWGLVAVPVAVDGEGPLPDALWQALAGGARAVVLTSRAQNPTGAAVTMARAEALREVLRRYPGVVTIEDDHGHGISGAELCPVSAARRSPLGGPWAFVRSASKAYGPDLRVAVVTGDPTTVARINSSLHAGAGWVSHLLQQAVAELWSDAMVTELVQRAAATYDERRLGFLDELAQRGIRAVGRTGLNVWIPLSDEASCVASLLGQGWRVGEGGRFRLGSQPGIRVTTAALARRQAPGLADAVSAAISKTSSRHY
ncbi:MAG: aminotransferase class I/II-fold pyridoxal phosphate-dependent enzyme [Acidimicrobiales bacterium]